jgi:transcriptional regulator with XRE-family HTH domain
MDRSHSKKLKIALIQAGINQKTLSKKTGIPPNYVSLIANDRLVPSPKQRELIANVLGCHSDELFPSEKGVV